MRDILQWIVEMTENNNYFYDIHSNGQMLMTKAVNKWACYIVKSKVYSLNWPFVASSLVYSFCH